MEQCARALDGLPEASLRRVLTYLGDRLGPLALKAHTVAPTPALSCDEEPEPRRGLPPTRPRFADDDDEDEDDAA